LGLDLFPGRQSLPPLFYVANSGVVVAITMRDPATRQDHMQGNGVALFA